MTKLTRWDTGETIHEHDGDIRATVEAAAKLGISCFRASLDGASLDGASLPLWCKWLVTYSLLPDVVVHIGCKSKSIEGWDAWFAGGDEFDTPRDSDDFQRIRANYLAVRAYLVATGAHKESSD